MQAFLDGCLTPAVLKVLSAMRHLIVTEAHRVEPTMWTALNAALQRAKRARCKWGGVQLVLEGDFLQLTTGEPLFGQVDFHDSFDVIYLHQQWRSHGALQRLLGQLAMRKAGQPLHHLAIEQLRSLEQPLQPVLATGAVHLFGKVAPCSEFNRKENLQLPGAGVLYTGSDSIGIWETRAPSLAQAALDASTNLKTDPLCLKVS